MSLQSKETASLTKENSFQVSDCRMSGVAGAMQGAKTKGEVDQMVTRMAELEAQAESASASLMQLKDAAEQAQLELRVRGPEP